MKVGAISFSSRLGKETLYSEILLEEERGGEGKEVIRKESYDIYHFLLKHLKIRQKQLKA